MQTVITGNIRVAYIITMFLPGKACSTWMFVCAAMSGVCPVSKKKSMQPLLRHEKSGDLGNPGSRKILQIVKDFNKMTNIFGKKTFKWSKLCPNR